MRKSCKECVLKHLAQAEILFNESELGYPLHFWLGLGHLAEAEHELLGLNKGLAMELREVRKLAQESGESTAFNSIEWIGRVVNETKESVHSVDSPNNRESENIPGS